MVSLHLQFAKSCSTYVLMRTETLHTLHDDGGLRIDDALIGADHYVFWRGQSSRRYLTTVYALDDVPDYSGVVMLLVRRLPSGQREALFIEQLEAPFTADTSSLIEKARRHGANEVHLHFLAQTPAARRSAMFDLKEAASVPLMADERAA